MKVRRHSRRALEGYLKWLPAAPRENAPRENVLFRPIFQLDPLGLSADEAMVRWEGQGVALPESTSQPSQLADLVQGKRLRDFNISEWRRDVAAGLLFPIELVGTGDLDSIEQVHRVLGVECMKAGLGVLKTLARSAREKVA